MANMDKKLIVVEGNIGSGKSTLLKYLEGINESEVIYEPVNLWQQTTDEDGVNLLDYYYKDTQRWAYTLQTFAFITRIKSIEHAQTNKYRFIERCLESDNKIFANKLVDDKLINSLEYNIYNQWFEWNKELFKKGNTNKIDADYVIYLRTKPEVAYERINKRSRDEESKIPFEYIKDLHDRYDNYLMNSSKNVLVLDGNVNIDTNNYEKHIEDIKKFIE